MNCCNVSCIIILNCEFFFFFPIFSYFQEFYTLHAPRDLQSDQPSILYKRSDLNCLWWESPQIDIEQVYHSIARWLDT